MTDATGLGFINAPTNRAALLRGNEQWFDQQIKSPHNKVIVFIGDRPAISIKGAEPVIDFRKPAEIMQFQESAEFILLNQGSGGEVVFAVQLDEKFTESFISDDVKLIDLRSLAMQAVLPSQDLGTLAQARSLLNWHGSHRFCANCGSKTAPADAGYRRDCLACKRQHFPRVDPVVIMLIKDGDRFLMARGHNFEENHFSTLAGFLEPGETIEAATRRETFEETGIRVGEVTYLLSQPWPFPSSLMIGVIGQALTTEISPDPNEIAEARWFSLEEIRQMLNNTHPGGATLPPPMSIAWQMMKRFLVNQPGRPA